MVYQLPNSIGANPYDPNSPARVLRDLALDPGNPNVVYACSDDHGAAIAAGNTDGAIFVKSMDAGVTWSQSILVTGGTQSDRMTIAVSPAAPGNVWAIYRSGSTDKLWRSSDHGSSWTLVAGNYTLNGGGYWRQDLAISPTDASVMYAAAYYANKSTNGGVSFIQQTGGQHIDTRCMEVISGSAPGSGGVGDVVIHGNDGGITLTVNGGTTWSNINGQGFNTSMFYGIGASELDFTIGGGRQDNDVAITDGNGWHLPQLYQDGAEAACHRTDPNILYAQRWCCSYSSKPLYAYVKNGTSWTRYSQNYQPSNHANNVRSMVAAEDGLLYIGHEDIYRSATPTTPPYLSWTKISDFAANFSSVPLNRPLRSITSCSRQPGIMYAAYSDACWGCGSAQGYLFKSTTGGGTGPNDWVDITGDLPSIVPDWLPISNVHVDPTDPDRVWVTMTGYSENTGASPPYNGQYRVIMSEDGGSSWVDYSTGLTPFVVTDIVYQKGSNRGLYLSTDIGVFYRDASMAQWECFNDGLPVCIISDLEIDHCDGKLIAASMGRGIWITDLVSTQPEEEVISGTVAISSERDIASNIRITGGAVCTVTADLRFMPGTKLVVEPGGKLIVDGAKLTSHCGGFWRGIEAWGTTNQHQFPTNNPTYQGLVVLKNGAVIEHALVGVSCGDPLVKSAQGGVVQVQGTLNDVGATFRNCRVGVEFKKYRNFLPSNSTITKDNNSYFQHTEFIVDDNYRGNDDFDAHARLNKVQGINFIQCDFINSQVSGPNGINSSALLGRGIFSLDASFRVSGQCAELLPACELGSGQPVPVCPDASLRPSRFIGLDHGIRVGSSSTSSFGYSVKDSYFENNVCGIYTDAVNNGSILRNRFVVGGREVDLTGDDAWFNERHRGIYSYNTNAFKIEENRFSEPSTPFAASEGVVMSNTGAYNNQVYKNTATGMDYGYIAENNNVDYVHPTATGLSFICNQNVQNGEEDLTVRSTSGSPGPDHCIKIFQGSTFKSAGNTFTTQQNGSSQYYNYHNAAEVLPITYFWELPPGDLNTTAYNAPYVQRNINPSPHNTCPTRILCGGGTGPVKEALTPQIEQERLAYLNLKYVYESLLDGGDFDELKETIMLSWPQDAWALRNELMAKSPYLSTDILKEAGLKNTLPHAMYLEVCVANPEATQRDGFTKWVQYEMPNPLPEYMVAQIMASWDQKTWRTSLEADMGWHNGEYQRLNDELITTMLSDTVAQPADSLLARWQLNPSLRARFGEVNVLLGNNRFDEAVALLQGLDAEYLLEKQGMQDRNDMLDLIAVIRPVIEGDGRTLMQLEPVELTALEGIATRQPSLASSYARNTLCYGYNVCIPPVTGEASHPKKMLVSLPGTVAAPTPVLIVHPNPASTWVAFSHTLPGKVDQARIRVVDPLGRVVNERAIGTSPGQEVWDTRGTAAGSYTVELYNAGRLVDAEHVVVKP